MNTISGWMNKIQHNGNRVWLSGIFHIQRHEPIWNSYYSSQVQFPFVLICETQVSSLFHVKTEQICEILPVFMTKIKESKFRTKKKTFSYPPACLSRKRMGIYKCKTPDHSHRVQPTRTFRPSSERRKALQQSTAWACMGFVARNTGERMKYETRSPV